MNGRNVVQITRWIFCENGYLITRSRNRDQFHVTGTTLAAAEGQTVWTLGGQGRADRPQPTAAEVMKQAIEIDEQLGHLFTFLP